MILSKKVLIVAEIGINHNGNMDIAMEMVEKAKESGADMVKFQTYQTEELVIKGSNLADYQKEGGSSLDQYTMLKKYELSEINFRSLRDFCIQQDIGFFSTPFDLPSIDLLNRLGQKLWKIPSGEITNIPYLKKISTMPGSFILSTGMATLQEIKSALQFFSNRNIVLLQCTSEYPTPPENVNILTINNFREEFNVEIGFSDHTKGSTAAIMAVALGATIIEKHFTLDLNMDGPDHKASLNPLQFKTFVEHIRLSERMLGEKLKSTSKSEEELKKNTRKSIYAKSKISKGDLFSESNLTTKRPELGLSAIHWDKIIGTKSNKDYCIGEVIQEFEIESS
jgi:N,N'-diacetyllegionaminate synthase